MGADVLVPLVGAELKEARKRYRNVFTRPELDYSPTPFWPQLDQRALVYHDRWRIDEQQLDAQLAAMRELGEDSFYVTCILQPERRAYFRVDPDTLQTFAQGLLEPNDPVMLESAVYSDRGTWGLCEFDEDGWAIVGSSSKQFIETLLANYPPNGLGEEVEQAPASYVRFCRKDIEFAGQGDAELERWVVPILEHVYGPDQTRALLRGA